MNEQMKRRRFVAALSCMVGTLGVAGMSATAFAAPKTYKYRCPKCKLIQEYGTPGVKKCPNDGKTMVRQN
ncbi:MAG: hypothetical protein ACKOEM_05835 [Planctomycetia bacterium]